MKYKNDYYNYVNNNYNQPTYTTNVSSMFDPYQGFIRGNMFPNLYNGYKLNKPKDIDYSTDQDRLLIYVDIYCFAMTDLALYLDLYPNDENAINLFNKYRVEYEKLVKEYEGKYGPLSFDSSALTKYPWMWKNSPWPWEV